MLLLFNFFSKLCLLLAFNFHLFFSLIDKLFVKILLLLDVLLAQLLSQLDLLIKYISNLFRFLNMLRLLLFDLLFVEFLSKFLNLTPFIVTNV
jgi:hypothetical protein